MNESQRAAGNLESEELGTDMKESKEEFNDRRATLNSTELAVVLLVFLQIQERIHRIASRSKKPQQQYIPSIYQWL